MRTRLKEKGEKGDERRGVYVGGYIFLAAALNAAEMKGLHAIIYSKRNNHKHNW